MGPNAKLGSASGDTSSTLLNSCNTLIVQLFQDSDAHRWGLTWDTFVAALARGAVKRLAAAASPADIERYLVALHIKDLVLACACAEGHAAAWEYFVDAYRGYLRASAAVILKCPSDSPAARELADSLFSDLYGVRAGNRSECSLFRYFHGRSSLKTWLRAVLAQRHIDGIRASRRLTSLSDATYEPEHQSRRVSEIPAAPAEIDPHRQNYVALFTRTLEVALGLLDPRDKERLRLYYAEELTLAEIGRQFGEHESSVSRNLERTRRELRHAVEAALRERRAAVNGAVAQPGLSDEQLSLCFEYAAEDAPIDLEKLLAEPRRQKTPAERQEP